MHAHLALALLVQHSGHQHVATVPTPSAPRALGPVDHEIALGVRRGLLRYDREFLLVQAGARVRVRLGNVDDMLHNWVLLAPGTDPAAVADAALRLGEHALARHFVPDLPGIVCATGVAEPGKTAIVEFVAPRAPADLPFLCTIPGHASTMRGVLRVTETGAVLAGLRYRCFSGAFDTLPDFATLTADKEGVLADGLLDPGVAARDHDYALVFTGRLRVLVAGPQRFHLASDDGARVVVGDQVVAACDGVHPVGDEVTGEVELDAGEHALRVDYFQRAGGAELHLAWSSATQPRLWLSRAGAAEESARQELIVLDEPIVQRAFVQDGPARAIAVGLPGGVAYCFDAERGAVAFGWRGGFLDVGPDRDGRGGGRCRVLGERFAVGDVGFPLTIGDESAPARFAGYEVGARGPTFAFVLGERRVTQHVAVSEEKGLRYEFTIDGAPAAVTFRIARAGRRVRASAGTWDGDELRVPADAARAFTVTVEDAR